MDGYRTIISPFASGRSAASLDGNEIITNHSRINRHGAPVYRREQGISMKLVDSAKRLLGMAAYGLMALEQLLIEFGSRSLCIAHAKDQSLHRSTYSSFDGRRWRASMAMLLLLCVTLLPSLARADAAGCASVSWWLNSPQSSCNYTSDVEKSECYSTPNSTQPRAC
jgi:hypothetical protein